MPAADVLLVSLGGTAGLREAEAELAASMRRAGAAVELVAARPVREWRTMAAIELAWALSARRAAARAVETRAVLYSSTTAALLAPRPGAVVVPVPVEPSGAASERDLAAITYGAHPEKKGLDRVLAAWAAARR